MTLTQFTDSGPLFFPVTPFTGDGGVATDVLHEHVSERVSQGAGAVFAAGGTGEFHALSGTEYGSVVTTSVRATAGRVPVFAGAGGSIASAVECALRAKEAGAEGLLLMPPYLVKSPQSGLINYVTQVAATTDLSLIVYNRDNATFTPSTVVELSHVENIIGFKDGHGDLDLLRDIKAALDAAETSADDFRFFNGLPTAETTMIDYRAVGITLYSSAAFAFVPEVSSAFFRALKDDDETTRDTLLTHFFNPLAALRERVPGYAIAMVKAGLRLRGVPVGSVRPPLIDLLPDDLIVLEELIDTGLSLAAAKPESRPVPTPAN